MEMKNKLLRTCTLTENVQEKLLQCLQYNDVEELKSLIREGDVDINYIYRDASEYYYEDRNALQIACLYFSNEPISKCIKILLENGADIFYEDPNTSKNALNFAAETGNYSLLKTMLWYIRKHLIDINNSDVIFKLIKHIRDSDLKEENFLSTLRQLLDAEIDINYQDIESGWTTIYLAAKYKFKQMIQMILDRKKYEINLDEFKDKKGKSARDLIIDLSLYRGKLPEYVDENSNVSIFTLYKNIRQKATEEFTENFETIKHNLNEQDTYKLLTMAVKYQLVKVVQLLLVEHEVNYERDDFDKDENPMIIAAVRGYFKILKIFVSTNPSSELISKCLFELLKVPYATVQNDNVNFQNCLTLLLKSENLEINAQDYNGNTALHYALRYQEPEMSLKILIKGATLASKDSFNRPAVADIDSETLTQHLNECIRYENEEMSTSEDACILINFTSLLPVDLHKMQSDNTKIPIEEEYKTEPAEYYVPETEVLEYMCTSQELKQHLKHPVILAFLFLKWYRIAKYFYINLTLYLLFVLALLCYITFGYNVKSDTHYTYLTSVSFALLIVCFFILIIREICQMILYKHKYFTSFENWLEIILLVITAGVLTESDETRMRQFSAIAIIAAAIEFLLLVGQFPSMSTNIMMLRTVSYNFFKLLLWYSILLFAFSYSFYTLFQQKTEQHKNVTDVVNSGEDTEQDFFEDPGLSLLKTIVMLTGEFDASEIRFRTYPIISHIIFVMFVFLVAIVLFNLLNGLAVSDTQLIKNDAELYGQILRTEHIAHIERILLANFLFPISSWISAIKNVCLFPLNTKNAEGFLYPNQNFKLILNNVPTKYSDVIITKSPIHCFRVFSGIYVDKKIQKAITGLIKENRDEQNKKKREDQIYADITDLKNYIYSIKKLV